MLGGSVFGFWMSELKVLEPLKIYFLVTAFGCGDVLVPKSKAGAKYEKNYQTDDLHNFNVELLL